MIPWSFPWAPAGFQSYVERVDCVGLPKEVWRCANWGQSSGCNLQRQGDGGDVYSILFLRLSIYGQDDCGTREDIPTSNLINSYLDSVRWARWLNRPAVSRILSDVSLKPPAVSTVRRSCGCMCSCGITIRNVLSVIKIIKFNQVSNHEMIWAEMAEQLWVWAWKCIRRTRLIWGCPRTIWWPTLLSRCQRSARGKCRRRFHGPTINEDTRIPPFMDSTQPWTIRK